MNKIELHACIILMNTYPLKLRPRCDMNPNKFVEQLSEFDRVQLLQALDKLLIDVEHDESNEPLDVHDIVFFHFN